MFKRYLKNTSGQVAVMFAVGAMTLLAGIGAAIDFNTIASKRSSFQNFADAAVLAAARSGKTEHADLLEVAKTSVLANNLGNANLVTTVTLNGKDRIQVHVSGSYDTVIMGLFGNKEASIDVVSESLMGVQTYTNVTLVLDVTGSMNYNSRLPSMKTAALNLVDILDEHDTDKLQMSVVPFSQYVNVGVGNRNANWIDVAPDWTETFPQSCSMVAPITGQTNCGMRPYPAIPPSPPGTCTNDGVSYPCGGYAGRPAGSSYGCDNVYGTPVEVCTTPPPILHTWKGCVGSRNSGWSEKVEYRPGKKIPGIFDSDPSINVSDVDCNQPLREMTRDLNLIRSDIKAITANDNTYLPSGLMWGWRTLDKRAPLTAVGTPPRGKPVRNIVIFMTDGANTLSKDGIYHTDADRVAADKATVKMCEKIKQDQIEIYSVSYEIADHEAKRVVKNCATEEAMYFDADSASKLKDAFEKIGFDLLTPRLTH